MASTITLLPRGDRDAATKIIQRFGEETGLQGADTDDGGRIFDVQDDHDVPVVQTLDGIDPSWPEHIALTEPGT